MKLPILEFVCSTILLVSFIVVIVNKEYREAIAKWLAGIMEDKEGNNGTRKAANKRFIVFWAMVMISIWTFTFDQSKDFAWEIWSTFAGFILVGSGMTTYEKLQLKKLENDKKKDPKSQE